MKQLGALLGLVFLVSQVVGCDSGVPAGAPNEMPQSAQTDQFKSLMQKAGPKMQMKGKGQMKKAAVAPPAESTKSEP
jgi:hypothetical protein